MLRALSSRKLLSPTLKNVKCVSLLCDINLQQFSNKASLNSRGPIASANKSKIFLFEFQPQFVPNA